MVPSNVKFVLMCLRLLLLILFRVSLVLQRTVLAGMVRVLNSCGGAGNNVHSLFLS